MVGDFRVEDFAANVTQSATVAKLGHDYWHFAAIAFSILVAFKGPKWFAKIIRTEEGKS
jgi:hypothetical protein